LRLLVPLEAADARHTTAAALRATVAAHSIGITAAAAACIAAAADPINTTATAGLLRCKLSDRTSAATVGVCTAYGAAAIAAAAAPAIMSGAMNFSFAIIFPVYHQKSQT
jgi:hypothetical protein